MKRLNEKGFSAIEGLLIVIILALIGFVSWYVWRAKQSTDNTYSQVSKVSGRVSSTTKKSALKTYTNEEYGFSFQYPETWKLKEDLSDIGRGHNEGTVTVASPNDTTVHFDPNLGGKGGDCDDPETNIHITKNCETLTVLSMEKLPNSSEDNPVYFYKLSLQSPDSVGAKTIYYIDIMGGEGIPQTLGSDLGVHLYPYDEIRNTKMGYLTVYVEGKDDNSNNSSAFFDSNEVKEATPVLKSFTLLTRH